MLHYTSDLIKWLVFTDKERTVLLEALNAFFSASEAGQVPVHADEDEPYSARLALHSDKKKLDSLISVRSLLVSSLREGSRVVFGLTANDREALSALLMLDIAGFYDYLISLEDNMATMGVEFRPTDDDRQKARIHIMSKLNA
ncbi:MAG: hypothetical protein AB1700_00900 [Bacillota bacterium]|jgi:hypothetical protein